MEETTTIRKGRKLALSTAETAGAIDTGAIVLMNAFEARDAADEIKGKLGDLRGIVHEFDIREGWRALGYESFREWAIKEVDQASLRHVYRLAAAAEAESNLGVTIGHIPESHLRPIAQLPADEQREAWQLAEQLAGDGPRQATHVAAAAQAIGDFEPLTESELIDLSRLGGWEVEPGAAAGKVRMRDDRSPDRLEAEERSPGGWRYELARLRAEESAKIDRMGSAQRQQELIARARAAGLEMVITPQKILFRADGQPYGGAKDIKEAEDRIRLRELSIAKRAAAASAMTCKRCGQVAAVLYSDRCTGCYHLHRAGQWANETSDSRWQLEEARKYAQGLADPEVAAGLLAEIADIESAWAASGPAPAPAAPAIDQHEHDRLHQHAESLLAGLLEKVTPQELRLLHCLVVGLEDYPRDDEGTANDIWEFGTQQLSELAGADLRWIEG